MRMGVNRKHVPTDIYVGIYGLWKEKCAKSGYISVSSV